MASHRGHRLGRITHAFPGEHYLIVRPVRDDLRRSVADVPRRGRRTRARRRRQERKRLDKRLNKQLTRDTHKGRPAKASKTTGRAPATQKAQNPSYRGMKVHARRTQFRKETGVKAHRPRALSPHHPYAYHILPVQRIYHIINR